IHLLARERTKGDAGFGDAAPFAQRLLALFRTELAEEVFEARVAAVVPMELAVLAQEKAALAERLAIGLFDEEHVERRNAFGFGELEQAVDQRAPCTSGIDVGGNQQPRRRCGRERGHAHELRVVAQARLCVSLRPAPVEDELAPRMRFAIERYRADQSAALVARDQMARGPTARAADAVLTLERGQELVRHGRVAVQLERVPLRRGDLVDSGDGRDAHVRQSPKAIGRENREDEKICASPSTRAVACFASYRFCASSASKYLSASSAAMQPVPAEVIA